MRCSRSSISKFSIHNSRRDPEATENSGKVQSYEKTIGEKANELLEKMSKELWVLNRAQSEYLLSVKIDPQDEFILNYMVRIGINQLEDKSFWFSWPDKFTGNITIHNIVEPKSNEFKREAFIGNLASAMNQYIQNISNNWKFNHNHTTASNDYVSFNTKNMICHIAEKLGIEIQAAQGANSWNWTFLSPDKNLELLFDAFTKELTIPQTMSMDKKLRF